MICKCGYWLESADELTICPSCKRFGCWCEDYRESKADLYDYEHWSKTGEIRRLK